MNGLKYEGSDEGRKDAWTVRKKKALGCEQFLTGSNPNTYPRRTLLPKKPRCQRRGPIEAYQARTGGEAKPGSEMKRGIGTAERHESADIVEPSSQPIVLPRQNVRQGAQVCLWRGWLE